jgi:hypothetical protein
MRSLSIWPRLVSHAWLRLDLRNARHRWPLRRSAPRPGASSRRTEGSSGIGSAARRVTAARAPRSRVTKVSHRYTHEHVHTKIHSMLQRRNRRLRPAYAASPATAHRDYPTNPEIGALIGRRHETSCCRCGPSWRQSELICLTWRCSFVTPSSVTRRQRRSMGRAIPLAAAGRISSRIATVCLLRDNYKGASGSALDG